MINCVVKEKLRTTHGRNKLKYNPDNFDEILRQLLINKTGAIFKIKTMVSGEVTINNSRQLLTL